MLQLWLTAIGSVVLVSLVSLIGIASLVLREHALRQVIPPLVSLAVGAMLGDAFIHLLPESFLHSAGSIAPSLSVLGGIFLFFLLEKLLLWRHEYSSATQETLGVPVIKSVGYINLVADGMHNLTDGMLIGASYLLSVPAGMATTVAVILHEIPHEIGAFGILIHAGFRPARALLWNFLSALVAIAGTVLTLALGQDAARVPEFITPAAAGGFIYIAASDLIPELHHERGPLKALVQLACMALGVGVMLLLKRAS